MNHKVLVVAPHPDDETLGCGGTLLRLAEQGAGLAWLIVTGMTEDYSDTQHRERSEAIEQVNKAYGFEQVFQLDLPTAGLDMVPMSELVTAIGKTVTAYRPHWLLLPHRGDVHSDHRRVFEACAACSKWFRYPHIKRIMSYETLSETDATLPGADNGFQPNVFFDIGAQLARKLEIMALYAAECGEFPFPRSAEALTAQARLRGAQSGYAAAEAFMLLRERND
jgi:LmbE family N-acetylglucosaminyl deacetylase